MSQSWGQKGLNFTQFLKGELPKARGLEPQVLGTKASALVVIMIATQMEVCPFCKCIYLGRLGSGLCATARSSSQGLCIVSQAGS